MGKGISPLVTVVLLTGIVVVMAGTSYTFITNQQGYVENTAEKAQLKTINITCSKQTVSWWVENEAKYGVNDLTGEIFFNQDGIPNGTLFMQDFSVPSALATEHSSTEIFFTTPRPLELGQQYDIELDLTDSRVQGSCTAGDSWWNTNWDYRQRIKVDSSNIDSNDRTAITVDTKQLIRSGKLQPYCQDLRIVIGGQNIDHQFTTSPTNCTEGTMTAVFDVDNPVAAENQAYLYYGNPSAENLYLTHADLYYIVDTSRSFFDEWDTLENTLDTIEEDLEKGMFDITSTVWGTNNSYNGTAVSDRVCTLQQNLPDSFSSAPNCARKYPVIDDISSVTPYLSWLNKSYGIEHSPSTYDPLSQPTGEAPTEGWGMAMLDVLDRGTWRSESNKLIIVIGDYDTNGGDDGAGDQPSCGDARSESLAFDLSSATTDENITVYSLLANPECEDNPNDGEHSSYAERQMDIVGEVLRYSNSDQLSEQIKNAIQSITYASPAPTNPRAQEEKVNIPGS